MARLSILIAAGLAFASTGCYTVKPVTFETFGGQRVKQVWVTRTDQSVVFIKNAEVSGDKLRGYIDREFKELPASDLAAAIEEYDVWWLEDPVPPENHDVQREVTQSTTTPIATGENVYRTHGHRRLLHRSERPDA